MFIHPASTAKRHPLAAPAATQPRPAITITHDGTTIVVKVSLAGALVRNEFLSLDDARAALPDMRRVATKLADLVASEGVPGDLP
ncbi:hypothetical protein ACLBYG_22245 [Methylobacterium sp. D53M]